MLAADAIDLQQHPLPASVMTDPVAITLHPDHWPSLELTLSANTSPAACPPTVACGLCHAVIAGDDISPALAKCAACLSRQAQSAATAALAPAPTPSWLRRLDAVATHRLLGLPLFLAVMYLTFNLVQNVAAPFLEWIDSVISGPLTHAAQALLLALHAPAWLISLVVDGAIAGVGGVLVFAPGLMVMYLALGVLEESGYLPRAALVVDGVMHKFGLQGRSFLPMMLGFGCNVPAIYAARSIENRSTRLLTGLMIPFMSCSARLPVYVIFSLAFFPRQATWVIWGLYLFGMLIAAALGIILSRLVFKNQPPARTPTLPPYQVPNLHRLLSNTWENTAQFLKNAATVILALSLLLWLLLNLPWGVEDRQDSLYGRISASIAPALAPAGFGDWRVTGSLITGFVAKEMIISSMAQTTIGANTLSSAPTVPLHEEVRAMFPGFLAATVEAGKRLLDTLIPGLDLFSRPPASHDTGLTEALGGVFTPLSALAFLVFVLTYVPCAATLSAQAQEFGWKWAGVSVVIQTALPWTLAVIVFQGGRILGLG